MSRLERARPPRWRLPACRPPPRPSAPLAGLWRPARRPSAASPLGFSYALPDLGLLC